MNRLTSMMRKSGGVRRASGGEKAAGKAAESASAKADAGPTQLARIVRGDIAKTSEFRWIRLKKIFYTDEKGVERQWEAAERTTRRADADAVFIIAMLHKAGKEPEVLLVSQFRPPVDSYVLEFPAGLIDKGETAGDAGLRELMEETGYTGTIKQVSPIVVADSGMTNANLQYVHIDVDLDAPENLNPKARPDEGEFIESHRVPRNRLFEVASDPSKLQTKRNAPLVCDARLFSVAMGLGM